MVTGHVLIAIFRHVLSAVLPGGRRHGHFPQMWQFLKAVKMAVKGFEKAKWL
jgi:hypothetical protein